MIECPYCQHRYEECLDGRCQDETWEEECPSCEKLFLATANYVVSIDARRADCLNGTCAHKWELSHTLPKEYAVHKCAVCGRSK